MHARMGAATPAHLCNLHYPKALKKYTITSYTDSVTVMEGSDLVVFHQGCCEWQLENAGMLVIAYGKISSDTGLESFRGLVSQCEQLRITE